MRISIFLVLIISTLDLHAQTPPEPDGRRYRDIVREKYPGYRVMIGGTTGSWAFGTPTGLLMDREFNYVTPENDFKQWAIHPDPDTWTWERADKWIKHIAENGQILRMHCPISPQCSNWAQTDSRTAAELEEVMRDFMQAVCERYNGIPGFVSMDVVNEIVQNGNWKRDESGTGGWETPWYKIGRDTDADKTPLYIRYAFEIATKYAPDIKLVLNHHEDPNKVNSWNLIKSTVSYLRDLGLRVDGIGWQAHVNNGWTTSSSLKRLQSLIDWAHENGLEFHVTEASVWINGAHTTAAIQKQADTYAKIVEVLLEKQSGGVVGWNTWHIDDGHGWQKEKIPSIFDVDYAPKPAYYAIQKVLENSPASVKNDTKPQRTFQLYPNYPNPFNPATSIDYHLPQRTHVAIEIYDAAGRRVAGLVDGIKTAGTHRTGWSGVNGAGQKVPSGVYFCRMRAGRFCKVLKMTVLK